MFTITILKHPVGIRIDVDREQLYFFRCILITFYILILLISTSLANNSICVLSNIVWNRWKNTLKPRSIKARLHRRFLSPQLNAIFVAAKSHQVSNMFETPAISRRQIALKIAPGLHMRFWSCNFSTTKITSSCCDKNRPCKRAFRVSLNQGTLQQCKCCLFVFISRNIRISCMEFILKWLNKQANCNRWLIFVLPV